MSINGKAYIAGIYEHPTRKAERQVAGPAPCRIGQGRARGCRPRARRCRRLFLRRRRDERAEHGELPGPRAPPYRRHGLRRLVLYRPCRPRRRGDRRREMPGRPDHVGRASRAPIRTSPRRCAPTTPPRRNIRSSIPTRPPPSALYGLAAMRHMHEFGTTSDQLAWVKVAASHHAQWNPNAMLREAV